jgi:hemoglobin
MNGRRSTRRLAAFAALFVCGTGVHAAHSSLFEAMGGEPVLRTAVDRFADIVVADDRINFTFAEADMAKFKQLLFDQLCNISDGPCRYTGRDMRSAHAKLGINAAEFNALAEDLYIALGKAGVPYRLQNKLMARLAPMKRDIVKPPGAPAASFPEEPKTESQAPPPPSM